VTGILGRRAFEWRARGRELAKLEVYMPQSDERLPSGRRPVGGHERRAFLTRQGSLVGCYRRAPIRATSFDRSQSAPRVRQIRRKLNQAM
jgi:hypothetical protein